jgi:sulfite reductase (ferredoxin)
MSSIDPLVQSEIVNIEGEIGRFLDGSLSAERFRAFRLAYGIYGQRQPGVQMVRVKIPTGTLRGAQIERLAAIAEEFANGLAHLTTRQDVQFHFVRLERVGELLRRLAEVGLTTREACGNSVRNVTACPLSGFLAGETFEVRPYAEATYSYLVRNPFCQQMARKVKLAFSGCAEDCAATAIHDIGALARIAPDGKQAGFKVVVGGGLGATPYTAQVLSEFVPLAEFLPTVKAILKVFGDHGNRRSKMRARLKFVVHKIGIERFRALVEEARRGLTAEERAEADLLDHVPPEFAATAALHLSAARSPSPWTGQETATTALPPPVPPAARPGAFSVGKGIPAACVPPSADAGFQRWLSTNVRDHREPDRAIVTVLLPLGDIEARRLRVLGRLVTLYSDDCARIAREQNLALPSVPRVYLRLLYEGLATAGLAEEGAGTALDVTSCPGADTCALGITSSKGLARAIRAELLPRSTNGGLEPLRGVTIKVSGCPNSCGQHHIANIGVHGVVRTIDGVAVPSYQLHLGGSIGSGEARIGRALDKIPARNVPRAIAALLDLFTTERTNGESFAEFAQRLDESRARELLRRFADERPEGEDLGVDWGQKEAFTTDEIGTGECAGAGQDAVVDPFDNVTAELRQTALFMDRDQWVDALANLNRGQYTLARVLLEALGRHPDSDYEVACELRARVIDRGYDGDDWNDLHRDIESLLRTRLPEAGSVRDLYARAQGLLLTSRQTRARLLSRQESGAAAEIPG